MSEIFLSVVNMSISASWLIIAVLFLRLILKKAPKTITVFLWGILAVKLVCPFSVASVLSLIPSAETLSTDIMLETTPQIDSGINAINNMVNPIMRQSFSAEPTASINPLQVLIPILSVIWILGASFMLLYTFVSYLGVKKKINTAVLLRDNIYQSEYIQSPFVFGIFNPKIYIPFNINKKDMEQVICHEKAHLCRRDNLWKPLGFLVLALHWFNPLAWVSYVLFCRDIELACDEKVISGFNTEQKADYAQALLNCSVNTQKISACPIAFGEVGVKSRVKLVLNYKKPSFWIIALAVIACFGVVICFLTNPINKDNIGIKSISAESAGSDIINLNIAYSYPSGRYSVRLISEDEMEYTGDGMVDYKGDMGKYRMLIEFGDTDPSKEFRKKYPAGKVVELEDSSIKIRIKRVHPQDHGFALYVGFDEPITFSTTENGDFVSFNTVEKGKLKTFGGTIKIPVKIIK